MSMACRGVPSTPTRSSRVQEGLYHPSTPGVAWPLHSAPAESHLHISGAVPFSSSVQAPPQSVDTHSKEVTPRQGPRLYHNPRREYLQGHGQQVLLSPDLFQGGLQEPSHTPLGTFHQSSCLSVPSRWSFPSWIPHPSVNTPMTAMVRIQECTMEGRDRDTGKMSLAGGLALRAALCLRAPSIQPTSCCDGTGT